MEQKILFYSFFLKNIKYLKIPKKRIKKIISLKSLNQTSPNAIIDNYLPMWLCKHIKFSIYISLFKAYCIANSVASNSAILLAHKVVI